eukprot:COSAG04_NODE_50_length_31170_cov_2.965080_30_plen_148_part_00
MKAKRVLPACPPRDSRRWGACILVVLAPYLLRQRLKEAGSLAELAQQAGGESLVTHLTRPRPVMLGPPRPALHPPTLRNLRISCAEREVSRRVGVALLAVVVGTILRRRSKTTAHPGPAFGGGGAAGPAGPVRKNADGFQLPVPPAS